MGGKESALVKPTSGATNALVSVSSEFFVITRTCPRNFPLLRGRVLGFFRYYEDTETSAFVAVFW